MRPRLFGLDQVFSRCKMNLVRCFSCGTDTLDVRGPTTAIAKLPCLKCRICVRGHSPTTTPTDPRRLGRFPGDAFDSCREDPRLESYDFVFCPLLSISLHIMVSKSASLRLICSSFSLSRTPQPKGPWISRKRICQEGFEPPKSGFSAVLGVFFAGGCSRRRTRLDLAIYEMMKLEAIVVFKH